MVALSLVKTTLRFDVKPHKSDHSTFQETEIKTSDCLKRAHLKPWKSNLAFKVKIIKTPQLI